MSTALSVVQAYYAALNEKDAEGIRSKLSDSFVFKGPMMYFDNPDTFVQGMVNMDMPGGFTDSRFITEGDIVAHLSSWVMMTPDRVEIPMCEVITLADGKITRCELYFDTKLFPSG